DEKAQAERDRQTREHTQDTRSPEPDLDKVRVNRRRHQKHNIEWIRKALLIDHVLRSFLRRDSVAIEQDLDFTAYLGPIGIASVWQKLPRPHPARIQIPD